MTARGLRAVPAVSGPIAEAIAGIPTSALPCRRRRSHRWDGYTVDHERLLRQYRETEKCDRCGTLRVSHVGDDRHAQPGVQLDSWSYRYPPGYLIAGGMSDEARAAIRLEELRRRAA